ncbi:MAG: tRNA (adenosine(37)-N6)-threonylcarbamoyltransferase complex dimerization subunit type 1 TsaB [Christensenella sp.]|nr:tRNA (adenosine(37)-N6)-threonylcarbamoyltransferase complex dimerization subunit type 1 TsaB [Christensenella sp.]
MILLSLDTTAAVATAAVFRDGALIAEWDADAGKKHAETALPMIEQLLEENGLQISQVDYFAVDIGPGSFTGVRIGVSLVNALAFATGKRIVPVDALCTLAASAKEHERPVCALIDARNGNAYAALYQAGREIVAPCAAEISAFVSGLPENTVYVGDTHAATVSHPRAKEVGLIALQRLDGAQAEVEPIYLRASQAERLRQNPSKEA